MRAIQREPLPAVAPVVCGPRHPERVRALVAAHPHEPLTGPARVHLERELLVVLCDRERARLRAGAAARMRAPSHRERVHDLLAITRGDRLDIAPPATTLTVRPRVRHPIVPEPILDKRDQPANP